MTMVLEPAAGHHFDPSGTDPVVSNNVYDLFGVLRYEQGSAQTSVPPRGREGVTAQWEPCAPRGL